MKSEIQGTLEKKLEEGQSDMREGEKSARMACKTKEKKKDVKTSWKDKETREGAKKGGKERTG